MDWDMKVRIGKEIEANISYFEQNKKIESIGFFFLCHQAIFFLPLLITENQIGYS